MVVLHKNLNVLWEVVVVYGPADHSLSALFLDELTTKIDSCNLPLRIGGDFNLLRFPVDKNNSNFSWPLADAFNDFTVSVPFVKFLGRVLVLLGPTISLTLSVLCWIVCLLSLSGIRCSRVLPLLLFPM